MATVAISNNLECSICCETFKTPKVSICGHTFCLDCIERYIGDRTRKFPCPVCRKVVRIPKGGAKKFTTNYVALTTTRTSTIKHRCPHHSDREVEFYCQKCREGVCSRCVYLHHKDHESVDIECDNTKSKAIEEFSNLKKAIKQKIIDMATTLQERSEKLDTLCDEECSKVTKYTEMMIADLKEKSENLRTTIKTHFDESQRRLSKSKARVDNHIKNLQVDLETKLPSLEEDSCLTILQALPEMTDLGKFSENFMVTLPDLTYSKWKEPCELKQSNIGTLESRTFFLPKLNDFIFSINDIKDVDVNYHSKNRYTANGVVWSCNVKKTDDNLGIFILPRPSDNPSIASCAIDSTFTLLDHTGIDSHERIFNQCFTEKEWNWGYAKVILWKKLIDKQNGFMTEDNQFIVQFNITAIKDIKMKTGE